MSNFSSLNREARLQKLIETSFDLLVIGGGITGAGIALDASSRGLKTAVIDMQDFSAGTSSRSTKLIHGGLRYLKQLHLKLVADVGKERSIVYENGPHITTPQRMMLPFYKNGTFGPVTTNLGLLFYDYLAGVKKAERRTMLTAAEAIEKEPLLKRDNLLGAGLYVEYKTDDARLVIEVLKKAAQFEATALNYVKATEFLYEQNKIVGVIAEDQLSKRQFKIKTKKIVNATGPWVDHLRELDQSKTGKTLHITKGVHLVFSKEVFPLQQAIYFDGPDGRMIFAIPRQGHTYVGTTDTSYTEDLKHPKVTEADRDYLLRAIQYMFPRLVIKKEQIVSSWAGLRPLIADERAENPSEISRKDELFLSPSGLLSVAGGKLTGYRKMAEEVVDVLTDQLKEEVGILYSRSETKQLPVSGGDVGGSAGFESFKSKKMEEGMRLGLNEKEVDAIVSMYGSNVEQIFERYENLMLEANKYTINRLLLAELDYAMEEESAYTPADFFIRRTSALYFDMEKVLRWKEEVTTYMKDRLGWTEQQMLQYKKELDDLIQAAKSPIE